MMIDYNIATKELEERANSIALSIHGELDGFTTTSVERSILRLLGVNGASEEDPEQPLVNEIVKKLGPGAEDGVMFYLSNLIAPTVTSIDFDLEAELDFAIRELSVHYDGGWRIQTPHPDADVAAMRLRLKIKDTIRKSARRKLAKPASGAKPWRYLIVASGNIYEDAEAAVACAEAGADVIAIIRSTAQSLLDHVPIGLTTEGYGGTWATLENMAYVRSKLDVVEEKLGRRVMLTNYASGLCMPEITAVAALSGLDMLLNDSMYGILFRDINPVRTLVDQHVSRRICAGAGIIINTGEDNYLTTADAVDRGHTVIVSQFINRAFAHIAGMPDHLVALGHAYEIDPSIENSALLELAQADMIRKLFPNNLLKYMPPTKHMSGDVLAGHAHNAMFNLASTLTKQDIHLIGILTEAIHTPFLSDRIQSLENCSYVFNAFKSGQDALTLGGDLVVERQHKLLKETSDTLFHIMQDGLFASIASGVFADIKRPREKGKGANGVITKSDRYVPFLVGDWVETVNDVGAV